MGRVSYKVRNTFVEFGAPPEDPECPGGCGRRVRSSFSDGVQKPPPPVAPGAPEPGLASFDAQGAPTMGNFGGAAAPWGETPVEFVPATPSPLLHPADLPPGVAEMMLFGEDSRLPPALSLYGLDPQAYQADVGEGYDPSSCWCSDWCVPFEGMDFAAMQQCQEELPWDLAAGEACLEQGCLEQLPVEQQEPAPQASPEGQQCLDHEGQLGMEETSGWPCADEQLWAASGQLDEQGCGASASRSGGKAGAGPGRYTTVMLRNVPNKYTREMLVEQLSRDFKGRFDFVYLPIDFKNGCNIGYGFINFRSVEACAEFVGAFDGVDVSRCLPGLHSRKVAEVTPARVQGLEDNVRRLRSSPVMAELTRHPEWMPLLLDEAGEEQPFPLPEQPVPPVRPRGRRSREAWATSAGAAAGGSEAPRAGGRRK